MKHFAAYALLVLSGNNNPSAADVDKVLAAAGIKGDKTAELVEALKGKNFHEVVAEGLTKLSAAGPAAPAASTAAAPAKEEKKPAKVEEEEVDMDMGDMFGY